MFNNDKMFYLALVLYGQIQMDCYFGPIDVVNQSIVAHSAHEWNFFIVSKHTITNVVSVFVANLVEIVSLSAH